MWGLWLLVVIYAAGFIAFGWWQGRTAWDDLSSGSVPGPLVPGVVVLVVLGTVFWPALALVMGIVVVAEVIGHRAGRYLPMNPSVEERERYDQYWAKKRGEL